MAREAPTLKGWYWIKYKYHAVDNPMVAEWNGETFDTNMIAPHSVISDEVTVWDGPIPVPERMRLTE